MSTQLPLRPYQADALAAVHAAWDRGVQRPAVVAPTGAGKTVMFAHLIHDHLQRHARATTDPARRFASRALVLVHRDELADQAIDKIRQVMQDPEIRVGKVKAGDDDVELDVVVASVQTLSRPARLDNLLSTVADFGNFGLVVVDECHHAVAPTWRALLQTLGCFRRADDYQVIQDEAPDVVGFSATLARSDEVGLGSVWQEVAYAISLTRLIRRGHLADVRGVQVKVEDLDLAGVRKSGGDYQVGALGTAIEESDTPAVITAAYLEHAKDRQGVVFAPTVMTAELISEAMNAGGIPSSMITGTTPRDDRRRIYAEFQSGLTQVLVSCMVLTEGFDAPWASCAVIARPTQSAPLYTQMVGRVLRPWPGKRDALVLDVVGVTGRLKLATLIDLEPGAVHTLRPDQSLAEAVEEAELAAMEEGLAKEARAALSQMTAKDVDLFAESRSVWLQTVAGVWFIPTREGEFFLWPGAEPGIWDACQAPQKGYKRLPWERLHTGLTLELSMSWAQVEAEEADSSVASRDASWRRRKAPASEAQLGMLSMLGMRSAAKEELTKVEASDLISKIQASKIFDKHYQKVTR
jgi:superfamily II DNA or RNA helicase